MDREELEDVIERTVIRAVPETVKHTLEHYGFDVKNPTEVQKDMQFTRSARTFFSSITTKILTAVVMALLSAAAATWALKSGKFSIGG